jgi:hypothetical protein
MNAKKSATGSAGGVDALVADSSTVTKNGLGGDRRSDQTGRK